MRQHVNVRAASAADREFILGLVPRLRAFGPTSLRPLASLDDAERFALQRALDEPAPETSLLVAELEDLGRVGVAFGETATDYFTHERHGHLAILMVAEPAEGRGVGRALLGAIETWSASQNHRFITLNVFAANGHAREVYERAGYSPDTIRYAKELRGNPAPS
ncbi:MAG: GNAT family N-acetyltransferase [Gemmatimonadota bacterium]|nr:GNAT family N-acetyltransferase [Gemmatimonadota bacterium]